MPKIFTADGPQIARQMRIHLNRWSKKPAEILLEDLGKKVPSMMLQQLASAEKKRSYIDGTYIGIWSFAVYIRVDGEDTASRLSAVDCLQEMADWLTAKDSGGNFLYLPDLGEKKAATQVFMVNSPSIAGRYDNGIEDYQAVFQLEYRTRR